MKWEMCKTCNSCCVRNGTPEDLHEYQECDKSFGEAEARIKEQHRIMGNEIKKHLARIKELEEKLNGIAFTAAGMAKLLSVIEERADIRTADYMYEAWDRHRHDAPHHFDEFYNRPLKEILAEMAKSPDTPKDGDG